ncbi:glycosyltransferase family 1 protein (plasmid) [Deinococcus taeanensis]|uniref:glycosyltransferase family 1 protein n=1 Tax=Deinococcus taeanensis TaxID=2737050 RepID=UPI001CDC1647|nr:glycosyltransferase family 1 protein [Deinococcus taeanensis]UBV45011.1 glycosyltransferase family 1 protein [Deinococcus taeanensis]
MSPTSPTPTNEPALIVLSHLRWSFVFQRPQHLMTRAARTRRVFFVEEPHFGPGPDRLNLQHTPSGVLVCTPHLEEGHSADVSQARTANLLSALVTAEGLGTYDLWVYAPMEWPVAAQLRPRLVIYDCMDELANFAGASPVLPAREAQVMARADVVFTGGHRLYQSKALKHSNVHPFPSSVDVAHFSRARQNLPDPADQRDLPFPRLGFAGVIDERLDRDLLAATAARHPDCQFVMLGPVVKINPADLPQRDNIHYLGMKDYADLPAYMAHWNAALMPFARNAATEFISPTKTPEYLSAGLDVISTGIHDVVRPYGERGLVRIADGADAFAQACADALHEQRAKNREWRTRVDSFLADLSWDHTWQGMQEQLRRAARARAARPATRAAPQPTAGAAHD